jgi:hypothetical protein
MQFFLIAFYFDVNDSAEVRDSGHAFRKILFLILRKKKIGDV